MTRKKSVTRKKSGGRRKQPEPKPYRPQWTWDEVLAKWAEARENVRKEMANKALDTDDIEAKDEVLWQISKDQNVSPTMRDFAKMAHEEMDRPFKDRVLAFYAQGKVPSEMIEYSKMSERIESYQDELRGIWEDRFGGWRTINGKPYINVEYETSLENNKAGLKVTWNDAKAEIKSSGIDNPWWQEQDWFAKMVESYAKINFGAVGHLSDIHTTKDGNVFVHIIVPEVE